MEWSKNLDMSRIIGATLLLFLVGLNRHYLCRPSCGVPRKPVVVTMPDPGLITLVFNKVVLLLTGSAGVLISICAAIWASVSAVITSRMIERRKAQLNIELERTKADLNRELEGFKADLSKENEAHKLKLRKLELIFNRELEAAGEFLKMHQQIQPRYSHPDMIWDDATQAVAESFGTTENRLQDFMAKFGPVLDAPVRKSLDECISLHPATSSSLHKATSVVPEPRPKSYSRNSP